MISIEKAVRRLNKIDEIGDPEEEHAAADSILLEALPPEVREAWDNIKMPFWYA